MNAGYILSTVTSTLLCFCHQMPDFSCICAWCPNLNTETGSRAKMLLVCSGLKTLELCWTHALVLKQRQRRLLLSS